MDYEVVTTVVGIIITDVVGVVGFFLKCTMNTCSKKLNEKYATKEELKEIKADIADMRAAIDYVKDNCKTQHIT